MQIDVVLEVLRACIIGSVVVLLAYVSQKSGLFKTKDWSFIFIGFCLLFLGSVVDITDNFQSLNKYVIIGDTEYQAFLEKILGYLFGFLFIAMGLWKWIPKIIAYEQQAESRISKAEKEISVLGGLLPICANCKKIRNDKGYWQQVEQYVKAHSKVEFSHGICPDCITQLYPDLADDSGDPVPT